MNDRDKEILCKNCHIVMTKILSVPAFTPSSWGADWRAGLSGSSVQSTALGRPVASRKEEEDIMRSRGFVPESDLGSHFIDDFNAKRREAVLEQDKVNATYHQNLKAFGGDKIKAMTETFPAHECVSGEKKTSY
jgi:hypothetical protein